VRSESLQQLDAGRRQALRFTERDTFRDAEHLSDELNAVDSGNADDKRLLRERVARLT